jgi:hypothetical protein
MFSQRENANRSLKKRVTFTLIYFIFTETVFFHFSQKTFFCSCYHFTDFITSISHGYMEKSASRLFCVRRWSVASFQIKGNKLNNKSGWKIEEQTRRRCEAKESRIVGTTSYNIIMIAFYNKMIIYKNMR